MKMGLHLRVILSIWLFGAIVFPSSPATAQTGFRVNIDTVDHQQYPLVEAYVSVSDLQGHPLANLPASSFTVSEDNLPVTTFEVTPIQNTAQPLAIALVIDDSKSMDTVGNPPTAFDQAVTAAKSFSNSLTSQDLVSVIKLSDTPEVVQDLTTDKSLVASALDSLEPIGEETSLYDAIIQAVGILMNRSERRILILITDGKDTESSSTLAQAIAEASAAAVPVYPIGFLDVDQAELENIALQTGGLAQIFPNASALQASNNILPQSLNTLLQLFREQYRIRFTSSFPANGSEHDLNVTVNYQNEAVSSNKKFVAMPGQVVVTLPDYQPDQTVGGLVMLAPEITAPGAVARLDIAINGELLTSVLAGPFQYEWNSTSLTPGLYDFTFTVTDSVGNAGQAAIRLNVQNPITVHIVEPAEGAVISKSVKVVADVSALTSISQVQMELDDRTFEPLTAPPYEMEIDLTGVPAGLHTISVVARDGAGFTASDEVVITVEVTNPPWWVLIVAIAVAGIVIPIALRNRRRSTHPLPPGGSRLKPGTAALQEINGLNPGRTWPLGGGQIRLGRKRDENDIPLQGLRASRHHAIISFEQGKHVIQSLRADNPVIVNDRPVSNRHVLQPGDSVQLGESIFRYEQR